MEIETTMVSNKHPGTRNIEKRELVRHPRDCDTVKTDVQSARLGGRR